MKKISRTGLKKKLDKLFSLKVRSVGKCERCGSTSNLQCAHVYSRKNLSIRWDLENAVCLCLKDHLYWAHKEPIEFTEWVKGIRNLNYLRTKMQIVAPVKDYELEEILETLI